MGLVVNGRFLERPITGVERYGRMLLKVIAREWPATRVVVPRSALDPLDTFGLEFIRTSGIGGHAWEQMVLPRSLEKDDLLLSPANTGPLRVRRQVVVVHDLAVVHHPEWFDRRFSAWYNFLLPRLTRRVAKVLTVSEFSANDIRQTYALSKERVSVVPPFVALDQTVAGDPGVGSPYYLVVGSLDPRKGLDRVLDWYRSLPEPDFKLVLVGREVKTFSATNVPEFPGVIKLNDVDDARLSALYKSANAVIQPSRFEGFGLPILEAMQHGCPVISSDLPVFRGVFDEAILYADVGDTPTMSTATRRVQNEKDRELIIQRAQAHAATFTLERTANALHEVLDPML